jgi:hypothetical protein
MLSENIEQTKQREEGQQCKQASAGPDLPRASLKISVSLEDYVVWYVRHETVLLLTGNRQTARTMVLLIVIAAADGATVSELAVSAYRTMRIATSNPPTSAIAASSGAGPREPTRASRVTVICSGSRADGIYNFGSSSCCANVKNASWSGPTWWK